MTPANAEKFATNVVNFLNKHNLDGVDFDWEYPGAKDIKGTPPGRDSDGPNYLSFLRTLKKKLPTSKTLSIAAPASYWYLRAFPISEMAKVLDYIVYMTYDLHGQWDYDNNYSQDGCPAGNCLRSHVNITETNFALAMITKAGVPANKLHVGISSYGRSFKMKDPECYDPKCTFTGPESGAQPGMCTRQAGYISNAELGLLSAQKPTPRRWKDNKSDSDMMVYGEGNWVAFMDELTRKDRMSYYSGLNFGGITDWALDLREWSGDDGSPNGDDEFPDNLPDPPSCDNTYKTLDDLDAAAGSIPYECKAIYVVSTLANMLGDAITSYNDMINNGYAGKFKTYSHAVADHADQTVHDYVNKNGNKTFSCVVSEMSMCCDICKKQGDPDHDCKYCFEKGDCYYDCDPVGGNNCEGIGKQINYKFSKHNEPCPPDYSQRGHNPNDHSNSVYWTLQSDKSDSFFADLAADTGIPKEKIKFEDWNRGNLCPPSAKKDDECWGLGYDYGMASPTGYKAADVQDPKTVVQKALGNSHSLAEQIQDALSDLRTDCYAGNPMELVDAVSVPTLMVVQAVASMDEVEDVADKIDEAKRKALIMAFASALLFLVPVAGEVLGAFAELGSIGAIVTTLGVAGNVAMDIYSIVEDPHNAPLLIFQLILEPLALANVGSVAKMANIRRGMSEAQVLKLGGKVADRMKIIQKITGACKKM